METNLKLMLFLFYICFLAEKGLLATIPKSFVDILIFLILIPSLFTLIASALAGFIEGLMK